MLLFELFDLKKTAKERAIDAALAALDRRAKSKGNREDIAGYAFDIARAFDLGISSRQLAALYKERYLGIKEQSLEPDEPGYQHDVLTMPSNTVVIDTPGELDWYKIGQHFPTLSQQDPHEYGQSESDMIVTFANQREKNLFLKLASKIGLKTKDIGGGPEHAEIHTESQPANISESFDQPYPWDWTHRSNYSWRAKFKDVEVTINQELHNGIPDWEIEFTRNGSINVTGEGDQFKIFATVIDVIREFIQRVNPERVTFSAEKEDLNTKSTSRAKLYSRMVRTFANQLGYDFKEQSPYSDYVDYVLTRREGQ